MHKEMRRQDKKTSDEEAIEILAAQEYGILSTICENGYPYGVPLSYAYLDGEIYFHCAKEGLKLENIKNNNKVSFSVVGNTEVLPQKFTTNYESVIVFGKAIELSGEEANKALFALVKKYSPEFEESGLAYIKKSGMETGVYKVTIDKITGKARR